METSRGSAIDDRVAPEFTLEWPIIRPEVKIMIESTMTQLVDKLGTQIAQKTKKSLITIIENLKDNHNSAFVRGALKRATREVLVLTMNDKEVNVAFETAIIQMATSSTRVREIANNPATEEAIVAPVARFIARKAQKTMGKATQHSIVIAPPSPPLSTDGTSLSSNDWKEKKAKKYSRQKPKKESLFSSLENSGTWARRRSIRSPHESSSSSGENDI